MELTPYIFIHDQGKWWSYRKDDRDCLVHGESFEDLQRKLHRMFLEVRCSTFSSISSNSACFAATGYDQCLEFRTRSEDDGGH